MFENRFYNSVVWIVLATIAVMLVSDVVGFVLLPQPHVDQPYFYTFMAYASFLPLWGAVVLAIVAFSKNRYMLKVSFAQGGGNTFRNLAIGLLVGFLLNMACAGVALLHGDVTLTFSTFGFFSVLGLFAVVFIQSSAEEALCRGYMYQRLLNAKHKPALAIVGNAFFFAAIHLLNDGMSFLAFYDLMVTGLFFSLVVYYFDSLWMAMGIHTTWNFTQSILLGLPNSGASFPYSIFAVDSGLVQSSFAYNAAFGLEGTLLSATIMTLCCVGLYYWKSYKPKAEQQ